jgi:anti-sigma B factor antagonist
MKFATPSPDELTITIRVESDVVVFLLAGEIDAANANDLAESVRAVPDGSYVLLDLTDVTFIDSSGLTAILSARAALQDRGIALTVRNVNSQVRKVFDITGVSPLLL